jgi:UDP-N-acetylglucosamine 1-carboxyvinyltransferase
LSLFKEETRYLRESGIELFEWRGNLYVSGKSTNNPFELFTAPYPGVNSDMQPLFAALALSIEGVSTITDLRFTDRFQYVEGLKRFGADIDTFGNTAIIRGGGKLSAADIEAPDLRGGMACVLCGLAAEGTTRIHNIYQIERGYEHFVEKLQRIGADVRKIAA